MTKSPFEAQLLEGCNWHFKTSISVGWGVQSSNFCTEMDDRMKIWLHWVCTVTARRAAGAQNCETSHFAFFVKEAIFSFLAFTWSRVGPSLPPVYNPQKHKICASQITRNVGSRTQFWYGFLLSAYAMPFFSCSIAWNRTSYWHWCQSGGCSVQHLPDSGHHEISIARRLHKTFVVPFLHIPFWKDKALIDKPMFVQVGSFCTSNESNLSSCTTLQQDFVICMCCQSTWWWIFWQPSTDSTRP